VSESIVDFTGGGFPESVVLAALVVSLVVIAVLGRRSAGGILLGRPATDWRGRVAAVSVATAAIGGAFALATRSAFAGRYASVYFPFVILLVAAGVALIPRGWIRVGVFGTLALLGTAVVYAQITRYDRTEAGRVADAINAEAQPGDLVVVCPDQLGPGLTRLVDTPGVRIVRYPDLGDSHFVNWVDYDDRLATVDPAEVADRILTEAGTGAIWLNWSDGYRIVGEQCGQLAALLIAARPGSVPAVTADNVKYFEWSSVIRLAPSPRPVPTPTSAPSGSAAPATG
jgi:hypothetical protein